MIHSTIQLVTFVACYCCFTSSVAAAASDNEHIIPTRNEHEDDKQCSIWMAPSGVKGLKGYGIFTTRDINEGESILAAPDSPSIPIIDYREVESEATDQWMKIFWEYVWTRGRPDHVIYEADHAVDFQTTFGSLPNHHCVLDSLDARYPETSYDDSLVNRFSDPGAGSFSHNMGREFFVSKDLKAGDEIFLNYGYCERDDERNSHDWTSFIPMPQDFAEAAHIAWEYLQLPKDTQDTRITIPKGTNEFVALLLPQSTFHLHDIVGSTQMDGPDDLIPLLAKHIASTPRSPEWIRENGMCLENLVPRKSLLSHAGQGAFAQFHIRKGEIIVPAPMLQITDKDALRMYSNDPNGWQLLMNYCFGHVESSMLLCPATNAGLVNHCSTRKKECGPHSPNAEYRWSTTDSISDIWRNMTVEQISKEPGRGLFMEIVALRDIEPGEEVYIDYGEDWEEAWENHVANWKPPEMAPADEEFITAKEANEQSDSLKHLVTGDLRSVTNHSYLFTGCRYWTTRQDKHGVYNRRNPTWIEWDDDEILLEYSDDGSRYEGDYSHHNDETHWPCSIIAKDGDGTYTVRIHQADWTFPDTKWHRNSLPRFLTGYPRESIHYFVQPYASDVHFAGAFRQPIGIDDDIFPEQWKNRRSNVVE